MKTIINQISAFVIFPLMIFCYWKLATVLYFFLTN